MSKDTPKTVKGTLKVKASKRLQEEVDDEFTKELTIEELKTQGLLNENNKRSRKSLTKRL